MDALSCSHYFNCEFIADPGGTTTTCTIISTNFPGLTTNGGSIVIGAPNVIIYCICMRGNVAVGPTIWLRGQESLGTTEITSNPYYRDDIPSSLIIPSFTASDADTFHCRSGSAGTTVIEDTITLAIQGMCICMYIFSGDFILFLVVLISSITCLFVIIFSQFNEAT